MKRIAFLIGSNGPKSRLLSTLKYAETDVNAMKAVLSNPPADYSVESVEHDWEPSDVLSHFERKANSSEPGDSLLFYFSGHGLLQRGQVYLVWHRTDPTCPVSTAIPISSVKAIFANARATVRMLILDCCHSGAAGEPSFKSLRVPHGESLQEAARNSASLILAACSKTAAAREIATKESGFLTHLLVSAFSDQFQEADRDGDGLLSLQDLMHWLEDQTSEYNAGKDRADQMDVPELYGDYRGAVYLTAHRVVTDERLNARLGESVLNAVERIREAFAESRRLDYRTLEKLARPIRRVAPTFTELSILDGLFKKGDSAAIFGAAVILQVRRDPNYMERLIDSIDDSRLRGSANWRVLRAVRDTLPSYVLSESGKRDLISRLRKAAIRRDTDTRYGPRFGPRFTLAMIRQIADRLGAPYEEIFTRDQLADLHTQ